MSVINLNKISSTGVVNIPEYYIGAIVNASSGPKDVKIISTENDLDAFFPDIDDRDGYVKLLSTGSSLVLKRLPREGTKEATLRITKNPNLRYVYPENYSNLNLDSYIVNEEINDILIESDFENKIFYENDLIPNRFIFISGSVTGTYNHNNIMDKVSLLLNGNLYETYLNDLGDFTFSVNENDLLNDEYTQLEITLTTKDPNNPILDIYTTKYYDYSINNFNTIKLSIDSFPFLDNTLKPIYFESNTYNITGKVTEDFNPGDEIILKIGTQEIPGNCDFIGNYSIPVSVDLLLSNNKIQGYVTTLALNGGSAKFTLDYLVDNLELDLEGRYSTSYIDVQEYETKTLVYDLDFNSSITVNQDYIVLPSAKNSNWNDNIFIYFLDESNPVQSPNSFTNNPVSLFSVSSPQFPILIPSDPVLREEWQSNRARLIFELLTGGTYEAIPGEPEFQGIDIGCIKNLCVLDESNNTLRLVFRTPVNDISYYSSNSVTNEFKVNSNLLESNKLLTTYSRWDSIISFSSLIQGSIEVDINIEHIKGYRYYITEKYKGIENTYLVSLDREEKDYNGENIFAENVINNISPYIKCVVHLKEYTIQGKLCTYNDEYFTFDEAKNISGNYILSKGSEGNPTSFNLDTYGTAVENIFDSGIDLNLFHASYFYDKSYLNILLPYLKLYETVCFTTIPDTILNNRYLDVIDIEPLLDSYLLEDKDREYVIYCFGYCRFNDSYSLPSSFYSMEKTILGNFVGEIKENISISDLKEEEVKVLEKRFVNYIEESNESHSVTYISNLPEFLSPSYLLTATYVKQYFTRYLRGKIGQPSLDLYFQLKSKISEVTSYTKLISRIKINLFEVEGNDLKVIFNLELQGLLNKTLSLTINLKAN